MQIDTMRLFCDVADLQNFSRAAEKHGISQSAVSQQIAQIEMTHRCQLINRKRRPLTLTAAGELFYGACRDILERYERLNSELAAQTRSAARIKVAAIFSIGMYTLQPYVKKFMEMYPKTNLAVDYCTARQIYDDVLRGAVDIGLVAVPRMDKNIDVVPFENERLLLVCNSEHPLANRSGVDIHELEGMDFIAFDKDVPTRTFINSMLARYGIAVRTVMEFDNTETIKRAIEINSGISILPEPTIRAELSAGTLRAIQLLNENFYRPTAVIVRKDKVLTQAGRYLLELLHRDRGGQHGDKNRYF
ncbi:MAG TPA: LysR family transcriptional regulator [Anaerohalosphaeraceae bacterium]|jgi:DNA-binding transcriptional LysR family regulator|nr:LysR family transcriptional regulator [Anaerohalosphaeraceae bacterium]HRT50906.1 LysR family transcriptional regulator [Anaerohalosphaeraceae bacterium]HRT86888.1 LysR family transcriptional regulator [Anaerohalosphaeraceae bacterium]